MKCDLKKLEIRDGEEVFVPCSRERVTILSTKFGRIGLCKLCLIFAKKVLAEKQVAGKVVTLENGTKCRQAPVEKIRFRRGFVVVDEFPTDNLTRKIK